MKYFLIILSILSSVDLEAASAWRRYKPSNKQLKYGLGITAGTVGLGLGLNYLVKKFKSKIAQTNIQANFQKSAEKENQQGTSTEQKLQESKQKVAHEKQFLPSQQSSAQFFFQSPAKITTIGSWKDPEFLQTLNNSFDENTLVAFDIDETLWFTIKGTLPVTFLLDQSIPKIIKDIQNKGCKTIAITSRTAMIEGKSTGVKEITETNLQSHNIHLHEILCTGSSPKGDALEVYITTQKLFQKENEVNNKLKIVFIDNLKYKAEEVLETVNNLNIPALIFYLTSVDPAKHFEILFDTKKPSFTGNATDFRITMEKFSEALQKIYVDLIRFYNKQKAYNSPEMQNLIQQHFDCINKVEPLEKADYKKLFSKFNETTRFDFAGQDRLYRDDNDPEKKISENATLLFIKAAKNF